MPFTLDRAGFKRLVWLQITAAVASVAAIVPQYLAGRWYEFNLAFEALVDERFGPRGLSPVTETGLLVVAGGVLVWSIASTAGLFWFKQWARFGFWASLLALIAVSAMLDGVRPIMRSVLDDGMAVLYGATFGAVLIVAYGKGLGADWFVANADELKD